MEITEVRVALRESPSKRLKAYATLTFDRCFVVRNIKIIEGKNGLFVAMPSRKPRVACGRCQFKVETGSRFCGQCGAQICASPTVGGLLEAESGDSSQGHRDIAHPITMEFRRYVQQRILEAYNAEVVRGGGTAGVPIADEEGL